MTIPERGKKKMRIGTVMSGKMKKTIVVDVERVYRHRFYDKVIRAVSRCYAHDERGEARTGDIVRIMECRPLSRLKRWRLVEIVKKGKGVGGPGRSESEIRELQEEIRAESAGSRPADERANGAEESADTPQAGGR